MKIKFKVPTRLNDIPLYQYQKFQTILKANEDNEESTFVQMKMLEIFCEADINQIRKYDIAKFEAAVKQLGATLEDKDYQHLNIIEVNGKEYGFIPKLEDMTMGEYVDLESSLTNPDLFHKAMAVMYRPIISKVRDTYTIAPYTASSTIENEMKDAGLADVFASMLFFWNLGNALVKNIVHSLSPAQSEAMRTQSEGVKDSVKDGAGINHLSTLQEEMSQSSTELRNYLSRLASLN